MPEFEVQRGMYVDSPWFPLDLEAMNVSPYGRRAFARFSRLLKNGAVKRFDFERYRPQVGARCTADTSERVRRVEKG